MSDFEKWFVDQDFYTNMRFIHGDKLFNRDGDVYRILPVQMTYRAWCSQHVMTKEQYIALTQEWHTKGWNARQKEVDQLKTQLNKMEACYIEKKKELEDQLNQTKYACGRYDRLYEEYRLLELLVGNYRVLAQEVLPRCSRELLENIEGWEKALRGEHE